MAGFHNVLKTDGFVYLKVPDIEVILKIMVNSQMDIDDILYQSEAGPISIHDAIYGYGLQIERSGEDFFAHKCGFTQKKLLKYLQEANFYKIYMKSISTSIHALAFKEKEPDVQILKLFNLI